MSNMVSKIIRFVMPLVTVLLMAAGCNKPYTLDLPLAVDSHDYSINAKAGKTRVFFYTDRAWTITLSYDPAVREWASINRTSGDGQEQVEEIMFTYDANPYQERKVTLIIQAGDLQETITFTQKGEGGIDPSMPPFNPDDVLEWTEGSSTADDLIVKPF